MSLLIHSPVLESVSLLLMRIVVAVTFFISAINKFRDLPRAAKREKMPVPLIGFVATAEVAGALGLASGVLGQWAAAGLMLIMVATLFLHIVIWKSPYWAQKGGWEYDLMLFLFCSVIVLWGTGAFILF